MSWLFSKPAHGPIDPETDEVRPRFRVRLVVSQGKDCRNRVFSGLLSSETEGGRLFCRARRRPWLSAGVLGGSWGIRGWTWVTNIHCWGVLRPRLLCSPSTPASPEGHPCIPHVHSPRKRACLGAESTLGRRSPAYVFDSTYFHPQSPRQPHRTPLRARVAPAPAQKQGQNPRVCMGALLGRRACLGHKAPWGVILPGSG